jgi:hypothetical protein
LSADGHAYSLRAVTLANGFDVSDSPMTDDYRSGELLMRFPPLQHISSQQLLDHYVSSGDVEAWKVLRWMYSALG